MRFKKVMLLCLWFALSQVGYARSHKTPKDQSQNEISSLRTEISAPQAEQQQIITRLDELKQLLQPNRQPAPNVTSISVRSGETFRGDSGARVAIIEYADFECPYCGEFERETFPQILSDYIATGKLKYFYRDLPLPMHARAMPAARAARCAGEQGKYWEMHDSLFARQEALSTPALLDRAQTLGLDTAKFTECQSSQKYVDDIQNSMSEAQQMRIDGTPTFFVGVVEPSGDVTVKKRLQGTAPFDVFKTAIDALLASNEAAATH
jgi:protein-disulfide isomerase